jgi:hypothetical protein
MRGVQISVGPAEVVIASVLKSRAISAARTIRSHSSLRVAGRFYVASALVPIGPRSREPEASLKNGFN